MSTDPAGSETEDGEIETEHPLQRYFRQYLGPVAQFFTAENKYKFRRTVEGLILLVLGLGLVWWAIELFVIGGINV